MRVPPDGHREDILVAQPYSDLIRYPEELRNLGLGTMKGGVDRSWHFPGSTYLVLIGSARILSSVNIDYDVSGCAPIPADCR